MLSKKYRYYQWAIFVFCVVFSLNRAARVSALSNERSRSTIFGDGYSDINTISSARYFLDSGFSKTVFLPVHNYKVNASEPAGVYTHYPALPNILTGLGGYVFHSGSEFALRLLPIFLSVFLFFLIFKVVRIILQNETEAFIGASVLWLSNYFLIWADNLHQHLYGELLKWLYIFLLHQYYENGRKNRWQLIYLLLILILQVNISFEQPVFLGILTLGYSIAYQKKLFTLETLLGLLAILVGFGLHLLQNAIYFGSFELALDDMKSALFFRSAGIEYGDYKNESSFGLISLWEIPFNWFNRMERFYLLPGWGLLFIFIRTYQKTKAEKPRALKLSFCYFFAGISWTLIMVQHGYMHTFTNKHLAVWYALVAGMCLPRFYKLVKQTIKHRIYWKIFLFAIVVLYCLVMFATQQFYEVYLRYGFAYPYLGT